jgi:hypothetical protein
MMPLELVQMHAGCLVFGLGVGDGALLAHWAQRYSGRADEILLLRDNRLF